MTRADVTEELAARGDLDGLLRHLDDLIDAADWDEVLRLRRLARAAIERGHQVWPAATHAEYRLALEAPAAFCAQVLVPDVGRFALGPLAEVAACRHTWAELAPHLEPGAVREQFALERVVRGEDLTGSGPEAELHTDLPLVLAPWEPEYPLAHYRVDTVEADPPPLPPIDRGAMALAASPVDLLDDPAATDALRSIVAHWVDRSNGRSEALAVAGGYAEALAALGVPSPRVVRLEPADAMALVAWAAGSSGAHGRRRGMAAARFELWWLLTALGGLSDEWPLHPDEVGEIAQDLRWWLWDASEPTTGWSLRLVVEDTTDTLAWIVSSTDA